MLIQDLLKISEDLGKSADDFTKSAHKARLDRMKPEDLHAHIAKHAGEAKYNDEKPSAADIKGHAMRTAERLGHEDKNVYWDKIKHLVKEDETLDELYHFAAPGGDGRPDDAPKAPHFGEPLETVYSGSKGWVKVPHTAEEAKRICRGTKWDIQEPRYFNMYSKKGPIYIAFDKDSGERYAISAAHSIIVDANDAHVKYVDLPSWIKQVISRHKDSEWDQLPESVNEAISDELVMKIGKKHCVDFEDADAKQAKAAIKAAYKKGFNDGHKAGRGES